VARAVEGLQPENVAVVYKKIEPKKAGNRNIIPLLGNQEFLLAALVLLAISSIGCLALVGKSRWQRSKIEKLQQELQDVVSQRATPAQLGASPAPSKAARMG
jgi:type III secretory pathway lipoprotein EscJ